MINLKLELIILLSSLGEKYHIWPPPLHFIGIYGARCWTVRRQGGLAAPALRGLHTLWGQL